MCGKLKKKKGRKTNFPTTSICFLKNSKISSNQKVSRKKKEREVFLMHGGCEQTTATLLSLCNFHRTFNSFSHHLHHNAANPVERATSGFAILVFLPSSLEHTMFAFIPSLLLSCFMYSEDHKRSFT